MRGKRLASPARRASRKDARWKNVQVTVYGRTFSDMLATLRRAS